MDPSTDKGPKRRLSVEQKENKKKLDQRRDQTRVNLGRAFAEWGQVRESEDFKTDADLALLLLKFYKRWQTGSTPSKKRPRPPQPLVSSVTEDSDLYKQSYNKKSKNWTVSTMKEKKEYTYILSTGTPVGESSVGFRVQGFLHQ
ncbi:unnamed protein product [Boreogadus saida]